MKVRSIHIKSALILLAFWLLGSSYFYLNNKNDKETYLNTQLTQLHKTWLGTGLLQQNSKLGYAQNYFLNPEIVQALLTAQNSPSQQELAASRKTIYESLQVLFQQLKIQGVYDLQVFLPDNSRLVTLSQSLSEQKHKKPSLNNLCTRHTNLTNKPQSCFELDKNTAGFKSSFPIISLGKKIGVVEFATSFSSLEQEFKITDTQNIYSLVINPHNSQVDLASYQEKYLKSNLVEGWFDYPSAYNQDLITELKAKLQADSQVNQKMLANQDFVLDTKYSNDNYVVSFLAIQNSNLRNNGYLIAFHPAAVLNNLERDLLDNLLIFSSLMFFIALGVFALLRRHEELTISATAFEVQEGILITDIRGRIIRINKSFTEITGYSFAEVQGKTPAILSSGKQDKEFYQIMWQSLLETGSWRGEIWNRRKNGEYYAEWLTISSVRNSKGKIIYFVGAFLDITQRKEDEEQIRKLAFYDPLTELPNRRLFLERLHHALNTSSRNLRHGAVLFIDLDNFKLLNDTRGHDTGDELLIMVGQRLLETISYSDTVARFGGDEFIVLLENLNKDIHKAVVEVEFIAEEIRVALNEPYIIKDLSHFSSPSIGISIFQGLSEPFDEVLKKADNAMYQAKNAGRNTIRIFDPEMQKEVEMQAYLIEELREAIDNHELTLFYQPQFNCSQGITGAEALLRWKHPKKGFISPEIFIPLAERSGLIHKLGSCVLQQACLTLSRWKNIPQFSDLTISVNISALQLHQDDFVSNIKHWLYYYGIPANVLILEITESMMLKDMDSIITKLEALKAIGLIFSMDDFGTGYSSLSSLSQLPLDEVKIDKSFIQSMEGNPENMELVQAIIAMSQALGLKVIAEGIEEKYQQKILEKMQCFDYQGYLYAKPMPYDELESFINKNLSGENLCRC